MKKKPGSRNVPLLNHDIRFQFYVWDGATGTNRKTRCNICYHDFEVPEVEALIHGFTICPTCIQFGPKAVAAEIELTIGRMDRLMTWADHPDDIQGIRKQYLATAKALRRISSFYDIPGGAVSIAIALVHPETIRRGYQRKPGNSPSAHQVGPRGISHLLESMKVA